MSNRRRRFSRGRWQLERERFQIPQAESPYPDKAYRIGEVVRAVRQELGVTGPDWEEELLEHWKDLMGEKYARHVRPGRYREGTLILFVSHPVWLSELFRVGTGELLRRLQRRFGPDRIRAIRLQLDPDLHPDVSG